MRALSLLLAVAAAALAALGDAPVAGAEPVSSDGRRARVWAEIVGGVPATSATYDGGGGAWQCTPAGFDVDAAFVDAPALDAFPPGTTFLPADLTRRTYGRYWVTCLGPDGARYDEIGWLQDVVDVDALAREFAARYLAEEVAPAVTIGAAPAERALVGTSTWFWIEGYDGSDLVSDHAVLGRSLRLRLALDDARWSFGDGTTAVLGRSGLGTRTGGEVAHRYRERSTSAAAPDGAFTSTVALRFSISYTLDGRGPFDVTPALETTASRPVVVREAQALLR